MEPYNKVLQSASTIMLKFSSNGFYYHTSLGDRTKLICEKPLWELTWVSNPTQDKYKFIVAFISNMKSFRQVHQIFNRQCFEQN